MSFDDGADSHGREESHEVRDHVRDAHQSSRKVGSDVDVVGVETGVIKPENI